MRSAELKSMFGLVASLALAPLVAQTNPARQPIARIGDQAIYEEDLLPAIGGQLWQLKNQEYDLKRTALVNLVNQRLLDQEANRKGLSVDALLETVHGSVPPPSAGEIEAYYLAQKDRINRPLSEVRPQLEKALLEARRQQARQDYIDGLRQRAGVAILLHAPKVEVSVDASRVRGAPDAAVTIVEFSDFQCPHCRAVQPTLSALLDKYKGKVRLGFRDFPLRQIHPNAEQAAESSRCAAEQGRFWEYHDLLYANQEKLDLASLKDYARTARLDEQRFAACLAGGKFKALVENDLQTGAASGVSGTPAFFINGVTLTGAQPAAIFENIIASALADADSKIVAQ